MKKSLAYLVQLQKIDTELHKIEAQKGDLPEQVEELQRGIEDLENSLSGNRKRLRDVQAEIHHLEGKIQFDQEKVKQYREQLYLVTTNREYDALTGEIDHKEKEIDETETQILTLGEEEASLEERIRESKIKLKNLNEQLEKARAELKVMINETEEELSKLKKQRGDLVPMILPMYIRHYERILKARRGLAVVPVTRASCGGCHRTIPPQRLVEIRAMNRIIPCEVCGRILYWDNEKSPQN
jgi:predicted  nucleic acid-binding Zn-ribbon protein